jgi:predicted esterase
MPVGFSQGSTMGTMLLLSELERLGAMYDFGGFVGLNGWLGFRRQIEELISNTTIVTEESGARRREATTTYVRGLPELDSPGQEYKFNPKGFEIPVFLSHGETDEKVRFEWGKQMQDILCKLDVDVTFRGYEGLAH